MKHNLNITFLLLVMFLVTQIIGFFVINAYSNVLVVDGQEQNVSAPDLPYGMEPPEIKEPREFNQIFISIIIAFAIAIGLILLLSKVKAEFLLKLWFFIVIIVALGISFKALVPSFAYSSIVLFIVAVALAFFKIYKSNFYVHNITELFIYPGIAAVFVPLLNLWTLIALLILISIYDMWAVWHSGVMQKMAQYQIQKLNIFSGFFVPYMNKKMRNKIKKIKAQIKASKNKSLAKSKALKNKKIAVNVAILGGGDIIFPIIAAGVALKKFGFITTSLGLFPIASLFVAIGALIGLGYLFFVAEKKKFYPAMPFITAGIFIALALYCLIFGF